MKFIILTRILLLSCLLPAVGCSSIGYVFHTAGGHLDLMSKRQSISSILQRDDISPQQRQKLSEAQDIRRYASNELGLPDNKSYTHFVQLDRDYVTWVVFAAPELSLQPKSWCFWVVGCVPYRGYFDLAKADRFAEKLRQQGLEVHVAPVVAYSTLGWFSDPVLSPMLNKGSVVTADYIFHELAHQQLYIKDDTDFNEAFASSVAQAGVKSWLLEQGNSDALNRYKQGLVEKEKIYSLIKQLRQQLQAIYTSSEADSVKRRRKQRAFAEYQQHVDTLLDSWQEGNRYKRWSQQGMNNAKLNAMSTYQELIPDFLALFIACEKNYLRFYRVVASMQTLAKQPRLEFLRQAKCTPIDAKNAYDQD